MTVKNYTVIYEDENERDIQSIIDAYERLKEQGVSAIIGPASSAGVLALTPLANEDKIVLLSPSASSPEINTEGPDWIFRNYPSDTLEAQKIASTAFNKMRIQKMLMVRAESTCAAGVTYEMLRSGRQNSKEIPNFVVKFDPDPEKADFTAVVDQIVETAPQAIFMAAYTDELIPLIREIRSREELSSLFMFTCSAFIPSDVIEELGKEMVEGIMFTAYEWDTSSSDPEIRAFVDKFQAQYHVAPGYFAATAYDAAYILTQAINRANHVIPEEVQDQMNKITYKSPLLGTTDFNKSGNVTRIPLIYQIRDGATVPLSNDDIEQIKRRVLIGDNI
jgi:branched-chain amino acid transport system substrate-binding protein